MNCVFLRACGHVAGLRGWRRRLAAGPLALALIFPGVAHPFSLDQLLRLPLEQLLQLQISPRRAACASGDAPRAARCAPIGTRAS